MLKRPAIKQPLKNALSPILGLVFVKALEFLNFFYCAMGRLCYTKTFIFKIGFFCFVILKFVLLNLSQNSKTHFKKIFQILFIRG
ncbi:hypothetical protein JP0111_08220 [Helicobacter pylori]|nr:hypothetical protein JP0111_08220 [Helicobacter pylori]